MGSPYFVHQQANRVHVVRSTTGFERIWKVIANSMNVSHLITEDLIDSPEGVVYGSLREAYSNAIFSKSRVVVFLESRYEWHGWEKFQRVIIFDFSGKKKDQSSWTAESQSPVHTLSSFEEGAKRMSSEAATRLRTRLDA